MLLTNRSTPVMEVIPSTAPATVSRYLPAGQDTSHPLPYKSALHYHGIPPPGKISWMAVFFSVVFHAVVLLGFNRHLPPKKAAVVEEAPTLEMLVMPDLPDEEEDKPKELNDDEPMDLPSIAVPTLADIPVLMPDSSSFVQQLDMSIPLKSDSAAGQLVSIPVNILHGRPDDRGIKNLFNISELDRAPQPVVRTQPAYPYEMKREGIAGRVTVGFIVDYQGNVIMPYVVSSTNSGFERSAVEAVKKWKFRPGMKGGRKVNTRVEQPMDFKVTEEIDG
jgi:periplasmic protein TonB